MIKAVVSKGVIVPRDPLPEDWQEGTEVAVEKFSSDTAVDKDIHPTDLWMDEVEPSPCKATRRMTNGWTLRFRRFAAAKRNWLERSREGERGLADRGQGL